MNRSAAGRGLGLALLAASAILTTGCSGKMNVEPVRPEFSRGYGCGEVEVSAQTVAKDLYPDRGVDACSVLEQFGMPNRVDRIRMGQDFFDTWMYPSFTAVLRCSGDECDSEEAEWEVIYSGG